MVVTIMPFQAYAAGKKKAKVIKEPVVSASSYVVMSGSTSEDVYEVNSDRNMPIGSITMFMTAMVTIDNIHNDEEYSNKIEIDGKIAKCGTDFKKGDKVSVEDLINVMLVSGSNQAAMALAKYSASKESIFISEMNSKGMEIGLVSTQFANPTGLYNPDHYSTAEECAILVQAAMRYERIKKAVSMDSVSVEVGRKKNGTLTFTNTNPLLSSTKRSEQYENITGGMLSTLDKPTIQSQYVGISSQDGMQLIVVMLECSESTAAKEAIELFDYGYNKVTKNPIVKEGKAVGHVRVRGGDKTSVTAYTECKGYAYIPPEGSDDLVQTKVVLYDDLNAPLSAGTKVGEYQIYVADELKGTVDLIIKKDVKEGWLPSKIYISNFATFLICFVLLLLVFIILRLRAINRHKKKMREIKRREKIREEARKQEALDRDRKMRKWTYSRYYDSKDLNDTINSRK